MKGKMHNQEEARQVSATCVLGSRKKKRALSISEENRGKGRFDHNGGGAARRQTKNGRNGGGGGEEGNRPGFLL